MLIVGPEAGPPKGRAWLLCRCCTKGFQAFARGQVLALRQLRVLVVRSQSLARLTAGVAGLSLLRRLDLSANAKLEIDADVPLGALWELRSLDLSAPAWPLRVAPDVDVLGLKLGPTSPACCGSCVPWAECARSALPSCPGLPGAMTSLHCLSVCACP